ncbi:hypothetical protein N1851_016061 [Merluccius polli]|uniref:Uncharacterized protein n=1 Tax=Merluccius polli TaxID=89951 RepID=A0AA47P322_MERPO|nr:hypothetical protein N1851_016061 [Merluccius polli]
MVAHLFQGSFKKQLTFMLLVSKLKEPVITLTLENVTPEEWDQSTSSRPIPSTACGELPAGFDIPVFPRDVQALLDNKQPCYKTPKYRNVIVRVLYEAVAQYTMYPTNADYVQAVKSLISKYPFLKDLEGNGYVSEYL